MSNILTKEEVLHVAELAKIKLSDEEVEKYQVELKQLMDSVSKIKDVKGYDPDIIISPFSRDAELREDVEGKMLTSSDALKNVPRKNGNFIEVPVVINE